MIRQPLAKGRIFAMRHNEIAACYPAVVNSFENAAFGTTKDDRRFTQPLDTQSHDRKTLFTLNAPYNTFR